MCQDKYARMIIKRGTGVPTIPVSADHRNGDWIATDIYEGELYQDTDTGLVYTRWDNTIVLADGSQKIKYHVLLNQSGTSAPTEVDFDNQFGAITWSYVGVGNYLGTVTGAFPDNKTSVIINNYVKDGFVKAWRSSNNTISINTFDDSLAASNDILNDTAIIIEIIP